MATTVLTRLGGWSATRRHLLLAGVLLAAYLVAVPVVWWAVGREGLWRAAVAAGLCWLATAPALAVAQVFRGPTMAQAGALASMLVRMGLLLAAVAVISRFGGPLNRPDLIAECVYFYLLALAAETTMAVAAAQTGGAGPEMNQPR